jgi:hypothetical protein
VILAAWILFAIGALGLFGADEPKDWIGPVVLVAIAMAVFVFVEATGG